VADITQDGAFSSFEGLSRSFAVIEGAGVELQFAAGQQTPALQTITKDSDPLVFEGVDAPHCKLIEGATRDLNVMCKHGRTATLTRAYAGQTANCRGYFSLVNQSLTWMTANAIFPSRAGMDPQKHIGWWIDFS
jgi:environmental stress-induced protein Ves